MWFSQIAQVENPGKPELQSFVQSTGQFLGMVIESEEFSFLWEYDFQLRQLAMDTFFRDIVDHVGELQSAVPEIPERSLYLHGLLGRPLHFKLRVLDSIGRRWESVRDSLSIREWLKKIIDAIDAILDSLIDAAAGIGAAVKEFKDALGALVP